MFLSKVSIFRGIALRFALLLMSALFFADNLWAQKIAFSSIPSEINFLSGVEPIEVLGRQLLFQPFLRLAPSEKSRFRSTITSGFQSNATTSVYSFRVSPDARFANGNEVKLVDVIWSLGRCPGITAQMSNRFVQFSETYSENWLDFALNEGENFEGLINRLGRCPILEYKNSVIFKSTLGKEMNFSAVGLYRVANYQRGKTVLVSRTKMLEAAGGATTIEFLLDEDSKRALSLLRSGDYDAAVVSDPLIADVARGDPTLEVVACKSSFMMRRRGIKLDCNDDFSFFGELYVNG